MLWIFVLALAMPINSHGAKCCGDNNLAKITWEHAVNSQAQLKTALAGKVQMIEADVILGELKGEIKPAQVEQGLDNDKKNETKPVHATLAAEPVNHIPIMGHPPANSSDLSLKQFLTEVAAHNNQNKTIKGVKLDFKSIDALKEALKSWEPTDLKAELWINADIITGPGKQAGDEVNAKEFFEAINKTEHLVNKTLSIGWTTELEKEKTSYNQSHVDAMVAAINASQIPVGYPITFPVRAAIAAESKETLKNLYDTVSPNRNVTFTVWSAQNDTDKVDQVKLQEFINTFGVNKVYVDVPEDLVKKLNLNGGATLAKFGLLNLAAIALAMFFRNSLH